MKKKTNRKEEENKFNIHSFYGIISSFVYLGLWQEERWILVKEIFKEEKRTGKGGKERGLTEERGETKTKIRFKKTFKVLG